MLICYSKTDTKKSLNSILKSGNISNLKSNIHKNKKLKKSQYKKNLISFVIDQYEKALNPL